MNTYELDALFMLLGEVNFLEYEEVEGIGHATITAKGWERLEELRTPNKDSAQGFVAMWFAPEMTNIYENVLAQQFNRQATCLTVLINVSTLIKLMMRLSCKYAAALSLLMLQATVAVYTTKRVSPAVWGCRYFGHVGKMPWKTCILM